MIQRIQANPVTRVFSPRSGGVTEKAFKNLCRLSALYGYAFLTRLSVRVQLVMPYLIDGHNLIPKLGLRLDAVDDELELIAILQEFCRVERKQVDVFFDGAPASQAGTRRLGAVTAHFVQLGATADNAIRKRLKTLGRGARNWTVVSSDRQVQAEARAAQAEVISSDAFAGMLKQARESAPKPNQERKLTQKEIDAWLKLFEERGHNKKYGG